MNLRDLFLSLAFAIKFQSEKILIKKLYKSAENFVEIFASKEGGHSKLGLSSEDSEKIKRLSDEVKKIPVSELLWLLEERKTKFLALCDEHYPVRLKEISDPPPVLFYKGDVSKLNSLKHVAIVGTRAATNYGLNISKKISSLFTDENIIVVSGLASGIDTAAHLGAVKSGKTVAVVGTGPDIIFPVENYSLASDIVSAGGLILSEYVPGTPSAPWNFPQRNRIISAISNAVIVIEGDLQSGALITARFAIKQNKPLFALPGPIDSPVSNGPNILIKSNVAELLTSVNDVLEKIGEGRQIKLNLEDKNEKLESLSEKEKNICKLLSSQSKNFEVLIQETKLDVKELLKHLSMLELKGFVEKTQDGCYARL